MKYRMVKITTWRVEVLITAHFPFLCESRSTLAPSSSGYVQQINTLKFGRSDREWFFN